MRSKYEDGEYKCEFSETMSTPKNLYIITTPKKRDTLEWDEELSYLNLSRDSSLNPYLITIVVDSWNNIGKYVDVEDSFFIFDEQRAVGSGAWAKALIKIARKNQWILLSATPGDVWMDYCTVFIANGFYKNKTEFIRRHVVYDRFVKYPKVKRYLDTDHLERLRDKILVTMPVKRNIIKKNIYVPVMYNIEAYDMVRKERWNPFESRPARDAGEICRVLQRIVNCDSSRVEALISIVKTKKKVIVFYNFNYERELIRKAARKNRIRIAEWSGHRHDSIPKTEEWIFLVQYTAGSEGWNCIETDTIAFYSQSYSYKAMIQAAGRIDRINTPYHTLYYYRFMSKSSIDESIKKCLDRKKDFNARGFARNERLF